MKFIDLPIRRRSVYGHENRHDDRRTVYLARGTLVVWDVDVLREKIVRVYRASDPNAPTVYGKGETTEAEPALPEWTLAVDEFIP